MKYGSFCFFVKIDLITPVFLNNEIYFCEKVVGGDTQRMLCVATTITDGSMI